MYGFCERWIPELLGIQSEPYTLGEDSECSILFQQEFSKVTQCFMDIDDGFGVYTISSNVNGMKILLMKYWLDEIVLYSLTDGDIKQQDKFREFMDMSNPRFDLAEIKTKLLNAWNRRYNRGAQNVVLESVNVRRPRNEDIPSLSEIFDVEAVERRCSRAAAERPHTVTINASGDVLVDGVTQAKTQQPAEPEAPKVTKKQNESERFIESLITNIQGYEFGFHEVDEYHLITDKGVAGKQLTILLNFTKAVKKNVVFTSQMYPRINTFIKKKDSVDISKHTIFIDAHPTSSATGLLFTNETHAGRSTMYKSTLCFGEKLKKHWVVRGSDVNGDIRKIREDRGLTGEQKEKQIKELLDKKVNSPFFKYDLVFKDTYTNTIFAVKQKCIIYLLFNYFEESVSLLDKCMVEISRRIHMDIPYERLLEIDKAYFEKLESNNMEEYVNFAVTSSKDIYNETIQLMEKAREDYAKYYNLAMNAAKLVQKYQDLLDAFDMGKYESKEKEKARMTYMDTMKIEKISTIYIEDEMIHVFTKDLYAKDPRNKNYYNIGTFHIIIGMMSSQYNETNTVRIFNTKYMGMGMNGRFQAPHVWEDGHLCHGNLVSTMIEAYKNRNLFDLVYQIIIFLETANVNDGAGQHVNSWPEVSEEEALGKEKSNENEIFIYKKNEADQKFDDILSSIIPVTVKA